QGLYTASVSVSHENAPAVSVSPTATVSDPAVVATAVAVSTVVGDGSPQLVATFTDPGGAETGVSDYATSIDWGDGQTSAGTISGPVNGVFSVTGVHGYANVGTYAVAVTIAHDSATATVVQPSATITRASTTTQLTPSATTSYFGQSITFTATVSVVSPGSGTPSGSVDFVDTTTGVDLGTGTLFGGVARLSVADLPVGMNTVQATYVATANFLTSGATAGETIQQSVIVLNGTASGALTLSGNASLTFPQTQGLVEVDSTSSTALKLSGNAVVNAGLVQVVGGYSTSANATISPQPTTGAPAALDDPLAALPAPAGGTSLGAVTVGGNSSLTISSGVYKQISVSGNGNLTMEPGVYIITGGGFSVSGNASITGDGVMIYNAGSNYPSTGGSYGYVNLSGGGKISLSPETTGAYAGILVFQSRDNAQPLTLSGNGVAGMSGAVYAPGAAATISGNASLDLPLIVGKLTLSGNAVFNDVAAQPSATSTVYTPAQIRAAYGLNGVTFDGAGQTIAIVDAYDDPAIFSAVDTFDNQFGISSTGTTLYDQYGSASSFLSVANQSGQSAPLPATDPAGAGHDNWEVEETLDVEWAHAMAPGARIVLVEANSQSLGDLMSAVATAADLPGVSVVSMSWGFVEGRDVLAADEAMYDSYLTTPAGHQGVTFVASTGDYGANVPQYPAFSPNVVAVGGTSLYLNGDGSYQSESGWGGVDSASGLMIGGGGGVSQFEREPAYQSGVQSTGYRTTPDVSFVADPNTGAWIADTYNLSAGNPWEIVGGTSLSAPSFAALFALVNQGRVAAGEATLNSNSPTEAQQALYSLPTSDYHDVTTGSNGYSAGAGYDLVTGLGTPVANLLVPDLVAYNGAGNNPSWQVTVTTANAVPSGSGNTTVINAEINALPVFDAVMGDGATAIGTDDAGAEPGFSGLGVATDAEHGTSQALVGSALQSAPLVVGTSELVPAAPDLLAPPSGATDLLLAADGFFLDVMSSGDGATALIGTGGAARQQGPSGDDVLIGGDGDDLLIGGDGQGLLVGGMAAANVGGKSSLGQAVPDWFDELAGAVAAGMDDGAAGVDDSAAFDELWAAWEELADWT
ncbi:MAG: hypothetical protein B7Z73_01560, partial [Planctomycetia bacterium 21-64-5]